MAAINGGIEVEELLTLGIAGEESVSRGVRQLVSTYEGGDG